MLIVASAPFVLTVTTRDPVRDAPSPAPAGFLGILTSPDDTEIAGVVPGSPAEIAGLRRGDRILGVDGQAIADSRQLRRWTSGVRSGHRVVIRVARQGEAVEVTVVPVPRVRDDRER